MKNTNQLGRSMVEMLGVLTVIGVLSAGGLAGYGKAMHKYRVEKAISYISDAIIEYQLFLKRNIGAYPKEKNKMAQSAKEYGLLSSCQPQNSLIAGPEYQTCRFSLGEVYPHFSIDEEANATYYTYMLFATLLKSPKQSCIDFLAPNWSKIIHQKLWRKGKLWITSNLGFQILYSSSVNKLSLSGIIESCNAVCGDGATYCSVVFDFTTIRY